MHQVLELLVTCTSSN